MEKRIGKFSKSDKAIFIVRGWSPVRSKKKQSLCLAYISILYAKDGNYYNNNKKIIIISL